MNAADPVALRRPVRVRFFTSVMQRQLQTTFRAVRMARPGLPPLPAGRPLVVFSNHPSWWDPAFAIVLQARLFPRHEGYAPIDAAMLERYGFFRHIGFFGVDEGRRGAATFLAVSRHVLQAPQRVLWITAQGRFADARERPLALRPGLSHLLASLPDVVALPLAFEYPFWSEKQPEALAAFGQPLDGREALGVQGWAARLETALTATCDRLATLAVAREAASFEPLLAGRVGVGGVYGWWQRARALVTGQPHRPEHRPEGP